MRAMWTKKVWAIGLVALLAGCGTGGFTGFGDVVVTGVTNPIQACVSEPIEIQGNNFLSEHGVDLTVRFEATQGTPFLGGTSAVVEVPGVVTSNTTIELLSPEALGQTTATITVILPGGAQGSSPVGLAQITGGVLGPPLAQNDDYDAIGNVLILVDAANGVLDNDEPGGCRPEKEFDKSGSSGATRQVTLTVVDFDSTSVLGGEVQVNPDGSFSYNPPVGIEGLDSFTYLMSDGNDTDQATVEILIDEMVWFIDDTASPGGDGRFTDPFTGLGPFNAIQGGPNPENPGEGDHIFVYRGTGNPYDGGIRLLNLQLLIGEGVALTVGGVPIVPGGLPPLLTNSGIQPIERAIPETAGFPCIELADENVVRGLIVDAPGGEGILGFEVAGPTDVDFVEVRDTGFDGISLIGNCTGTFTFGTNVSVTNAGGTAVRILGFNPGFGGTFNFHGTISEDAGTALDVDTTTAASAIHFTGGTITAAGGDFTFSCVDFWDTDGTVEVTSPTTITGTPFIGVYVSNSTGTFTFEDVTVTTSDGGFSSSGVELQNNAGGTFTFDDLNVTMTGDAMAVAGGVPLRMGEFGQTPNLTTGQVVLTTLIVTGDSNLSVADGEEVAIILGGSPASIDLDVTFGDLTSIRSPQSSGLFVSGCTGTFVGTGTTTLEDPTTQGMLLLDTANDFTFADVDISGSSGSGIVIQSCTGTVSVNGGTIDDMAAHGATVDSGTLNLTGVTISNVTDGVRLNPSFTSGTSTLSMNTCTCSNVSDDVVELNATVILSGTGNAASTFGTLCENNATSVTGSIDFGASGTCP